MRAKLELLVDNEEQNVLVNASLEFARRNKETILPSEIREVIKAAPMMLRCFHDFGYQLTKIPNK